MAFVIRWQQFTGPIVAKGVEDTALYVYHPLLSLNEVGGDPQPSEASSREDLYAFLENRGRNWPGSLDASSTHDTKRSEDVRARLNVLSEMPSEWKDHLDLWAKLNAPHKEQVGGQAVPDHNEEYFLYQTLLGVWPLDHEGCTTLLERVQGHLIKATREAMVHTRWTRPNLRHEDALVKFTAKILSGHKSGEFLQDFCQFQKKVAYFGALNGLAQTLWKIASPGVPDFYQGSELWDLRLVDPDNRGPIDFRRRTEALDYLASDACSAHGLPELMEHWQDGRIKLYLIWKALRFRRDHEDLFRAGEFLALKSAGSFSRNIAAFVRRKGTSWALAAVPRWLSQLPGITEGAKGAINWGDTQAHVAYRSAPSQMEQHFHSEAASIQGRCSVSRCDGQRLVSRISRGSIRCVKYPMLFRLGESSCVPVHRKITLSRELSPLQWNSSPRHISAWCPRHRRSRKCRLTSLSSSWPSPGKNLAGIAIEPHGIRRFPLPMFFGVCGQSFVHRSACAS